MRIVTNWLDTEKLIDAVETEDDIGAVLRMHLVVEKVFRRYLRSRITEEMKPYVCRPKYLSQMISMAALLGMPAPFLSSVRELNKIRNGLAHDGEQLGKNKVSQFARQVDSIKSLDPLFEPLANRYIQMPTKSPNKTIGFGSAGVREDFIIASLVLTTAIVQWLMERQYSAAV